MAPSGAWRVVSTAAMAFILVLILHKARAYSLALCQIVLLQVQSKVRKSIAAMQALHGAWLNFVKFYRVFWQQSQAAALF